MALNESKWINCFCDVFLHWILYGACVITSRYFLFVYGPLIAFIVIGGWHGVFLLKDGLVWILPCFIKLPVWHLYHSKNTITRLIEYWYIKISCLTHEINSMFNVKPLNILHTVSFDIYAFIFTTLVHFCSYHRIIYWQHNKQINWLSFVFLSYIHN